MTYSIGCWQRQRVGLVGVQWGWMQSIRVAAHRVLSRSVDLHGKPNSNNQATLNRGQQDLKDSQSQVHLEIQSCLVLRGGVEHGRRGSFAQLGEKKKPLSLPELAHSGVRASFPAPGQGLRTRACAPAALAAARAPIGALRLLPDPRERPEATDQAPGRPQPPRRCNRASVGFDIASFHTTPPRKAHQNPSGAMQLKS